ncbi:MAG: hypothetical protein WEB37_10390 [Bacteroidota bacterium]
MEHLYSNARTAARHVFAGLWCVLMGGLLSSCSSDIAQVERDWEAGASGVRFSMVFVIHGDGNYSYHDTAGTEYRADEVALAAAKRVAQENPEAEVFIFHQKPRRLFLFLFPLRSGEFSYYRNGRLIANESYQRDEDQPHFGPELELYRRFPADNQIGKVGVFLYYGHEIPEVGGEGYDASTPDRTFTIQDLAAGLRGFTHQSGRLDLLVLSTCFGGTPHTIGALGSFARTIIASPDNLHLSYFDLHPLERLDLGLQDGDVPSFAQRFARLAFDRLTRDVQTAVSVAVYDSDRVLEFIDSVRKDYDQKLTALNGEMQAFRDAMERCDCAELPPFVLPMMNRGVDVLYRSARFGRSAQKQSHSGWECWKGKEPQPPGSQTTGSALE